jgi:colicin import membrane protein
MKKFAKADLLETANRLMKAHKVSEIFAAHDGNFFLKKHERDYHNGVLKRDNKMDEADCFDFKVEEAKPVVADTAAADKEAADKKAAADKAAADKEAADKKAAADKAAADKEAADKKAEVKK